MEKLKHVISARQFDDPEFLLGLLNRLIGWSAMMSFAH